MKKHIFCGALCLCMGMTLLPVNVFAQEETMQTELMYEQLNIKSQQAYTAMKEVYQNGLSEQHIFFLDEIFDSRVVMMTVQNDYFTLSDEDIAIFEADVHDTLTDAFDALVQDHPEMDWLTSVKYDYEYEYGQIGKVSDWGEGIYSAKLQPADVEFWITEVQPEPEKIIPVNSFSDVDETRYYAKAVAWAVSKGITNGTTETTFSPEDVCKREQIVTFLWRAMGSPEPTGTENIFQDVPEEAYYYKAVQWAVEQGIAVGTSETTFSPKNICTRAEATAFLWRANGKPQNNGNNSSFTDVSSDAWYTDAVLWAVDRGITNGMTETTFAPEQTCTRGQIVTFLYRNMT